ncbi:MAG: 2,3-bisphosphoglycerate-independent phosphoglycerate mutase, partial [Gammaproteobacteria bacterium]|nr:2,3-bisphosphoglycerate-independent phosphoglycerate mutase [Gammaproteobacteria bacterium]
MNLSKRPIVLIVLDGWGYSDDREDNAIAQANKPVWDKIWNEFPHTLIDASAGAVGLPSHQMGNSEVGHLNLGAGRVVYQEFSKIAAAIENKTLFQNQALLDTIRPAIKAGKAVHIIGLLSEGGVHSHELHIHAMIEMAVREGAEKIYLHAFVDGRDAPPISAKPSIEKVEELFAQLGKGKIASIIGRYYPMDRDNRWPRVEAAYNLIANGRSEFTASSALQAIDAAYERGETDEFVRATAITSGDGQVVTMQDGDAVVIMNFRSDRARQITRPFIEDGFSEFPINRKLNLSGFATLTRYHEEFNNAVAFPPERLSNVFGEYISRLGLRQLRIAETEKYAHVTFFLNGGVEEPFPGEDRILIPSPKIATYD